MVGAGTHQRAIAAVHVRAMLPQGIPSERVPSTHPKKCAMFKRFGEEIRFSEIQGVRCDWVLLLGMLWQLCSSRLPVHGRRMTACCRSPVGTGCACMCMWVRPAKQSHVRSQGAQWPCVQCCVVMCVQVARMTCCTVSH